MSLWGWHIKNIKFHTLSKLNINNSSNCNNKPNKNFMAMFIGFMDGDGYFDIGAQKQYNKKTKALVRSTIRIRLATNVNFRDLDLLKYFVETLGVGKIDTMSGGREQVRVIFSKKDLITVILPLIEKYNLEFLTSQRANQFALVKHILDNSITHWDEVNFKDTTFVAKSVEQLVKLDYFADWLVGFTMAEGSFGVKKSGSAFFQLKQKWIENVNILKAANLMITGEELNALLNPDSTGSYQLTLSSKKDIEKVVLFFSSAAYHSLHSYKLDCYNSFIVALKESKRYSSIF